MPGRDGRHTMRISSKVIGAIVAAVFALGISGALPAQAAVASSVTIHWTATNEVFHGVVSSSDKECVAKRTVKVFKETSSGPQLVGKTHSSKDGHWKVSL